MISPNPLKISSNLLEISLKYGFFCRDVESYRQNPEFFCWYLGFLLESEVLSDSLGLLGFGGKETKTDPLESVSGREDPSLTARVVESASVGSDLDGFFRWVRGSNGFGQP